MILYFSGTGNSQYCAQFFARQLSDTCLDCLPLIRDGAAPQLQSDRPWVFVSPTYAWQIPHVFASFLRTCLFSGNQNAYFVMTCGSDIGSADQYNEALCRDLHLIYQGTHCVVMPENYIAMFQAPQEPEARKIVAAARPTLELGVEKIRQIRPFPPAAKHIGNGLKSGLINRVFYKHVIRSDKFTVSDTCIGCGTCVKGCVMHNICLQDGKPVWNGTCTHCMACICSCPVSAIEYGKASIGKPRYHCPDDPDDLT